MIDLTTISAAERMQGMYLVKMMGCSRFERVVISERAVEKVVPRAAELPALQAIVCFRVYAPDQWARYLRVLQAPAELPPLRSWAEPDREERYYPPRIQENIGKRHHGLQDFAGFEGQDEYRCHIDIPGHWDRIERYVPQLGHVSRECWEGLGT